MKALEARRKGTAEAEEDVNELEAHEGGAEQEEAEVEEEEGE